MQHFTPKTHMMEPPAPPLFAHIAAFRPFVPLCFPSSSFLFLSLASSFPFVSALLSSPVCPQRFSLVQQV